MPELPDLQVFRSNLQKRFAGKTLQSFTIYNPKKLSTSEEKCKEVLEGQWLKNVKRHGKELYFEFSNKEVLGIHLMLKGQFVELPNDDVSDLILELQFEGGKGLAVVDTMALARVNLNPKNPTAPDALDYQFNVKYLQEKLRKNPGVPIKSFLIDQKIVRGIGNAYVDEILWEAKISPFSHADLLPDNAMRELHRQIKMVLKEGEEKIKIINPDIIAGEIRDFMKIHHPDKTHSPTGSEILVQKLNKRKTYYTKEQVDYLPAEATPTNTTRTQKTNRRKAVKKKAAQAKVLDDLPF